MERFQKSSKKAESGLWLFTKGTQAPVSWQVAALGLGLLLLSEDSPFLNAVFPLLVFLEFFCVFPVFVHLLGLGSLLSKISLFLFIIVEDLRRGLAGKHQEFEGVWRAQSSDSPVI